MGYSRFSDPNGEHDLTLYETVPVYINGFIRFLKITIPSLVSLLNRCSQSLSAYEGALQGAFVGACLNYEKYAIGTTGKASTVLIIFDRRVCSKLGKPEWWIRYDLPNWTVRFNHYTINKAVTGIKYRPILISPFHMMVAKCFGNFAETVQICALFANLIYDVVNTTRIVCSVVKDFREGTTKNTVTTVAPIFCGFHGARLGAWAGESVGTKIAPGLGTLIGTLVGAVIGGSYGQSAAKLFTEFVYRKPAKTMPVQLSHHHTDVIEFHKLRYVLTCRTSSAKLFSLENSWVS